MATCVIPWTEDYQFDETKFRQQVRILAKNLTPHLYVFGTAGEGYAVTDSQFEAITRTFLEEAVLCKAEPTIGIISLSLAVIVERIERAREWGAKRFQLSLPCWGALNDKELKTFFRETCGRFEDCQFMHYNMMRSKRLITPVEYGRLAEAHANLVATKNTKNDEAFLSDLITKAPQLQHFLGEAGYARMRDLYECGLLISIASTNHNRAKEFFSSRGKDLMQWSVQLSQALTALKECMNPEAHMDGAYDKLIYKLVAADFPLRLLPPYESNNDVAILDRYRAALSRLAPAWLPE